MGTTHIKFDPIDQSFVMNALVNRAKCEQDFLQRHPVYGMAQTHTNGGTTVNYAKSTVGIRAHHDYAIKQVLNT